MNYLLFLAATLAFATHQAETPAGFSEDSIPRLPPSVFRGLRATVRRDLERRQCLIPQPWTTHEQQNVIRGAFTRVDAIEWAVLCSVRDTSQILVYRSAPTNTAHVVDSLERSADAEWVQDIGDGRSGYSRLIRALPRQGISAWRVDVNRNTIPQPIDHDAIEQVFLEKAAQAFYFARGRWYRHITAD
jgi:hypothetical protein